MGKNNVIIAVAVFAALLLMVIFLQEDPYEPKENVNLPKIPELGIDAIDKIELTNKKEAIVFEKRGEDWFTTAPKAYKVDSSIKNLILEKIIRITLDRSVSENKDNHKKFEVDESGTRLKAYSKGQEQLSLIVGKNTPDYRGTFVRLPDSDTVYATAEIIGGSLKRKLDDWRDKSIFDIASVDIKKIVLKTNKKPLTFEEKLIAKEPKLADGTAEELGWALAEDTTFKTNSSRVKTLTTTLAGLKWSEIVEDAKELKDYNLDKPLKSVEFFTKDGKATKLNFGKLDDEKRIVWVMIEGDTNIYQIRKYQYERFTKDKAFFQAE